VIPAGQSGHVMLPRWINYQVLPDVFEFCDKTLPENKMGK
jgi:hypothetical protein